MGNKSAQIFVIALISVLILETCALTVNWAPIPLKKRPYDTVKTFDNGGNTVRTLVLPNNMNQNGSEFVYVHREGSGTSSDKINNGYEDSDLETENSDNKYKFVDYEAIKKYYKDSAENNHTKKLYEFNKLFDHDEELPESSDRKWAPNPGDWMDLTDKYLNRNHSKFDTRYNVITYTNPNEENSEVEENEEDTKNPEEMPTNEDKIDIRQDNELESGDSYGFKFANGTYWRYKRMRRRRPNNLEILKYSDRTFSTAQPPAQRWNILDPGAKGKALLKHKLAKFLNLFTVIKFANDPCLTQDGVKGVCYHHLECRSLGGVAGGACAEGYGVCCYSHASCGERTQQNLTYFVSPQPGVPVKECTLHVGRADAWVSQIRLDFMTFELKGPTNGDCIDDQFIVSGQNRNSIVPVICGVNTGQHIYVDVDATTDHVKLTMLTQGGDAKRHYMIKITQLRQGDRLTSPRNCLQFYRGPTGTVESFNYQQVPGNIGTTVGYMNKLNYAICIRKEDNYCHINYNTAGEFQITNVDADGVALISPRQAGVETFNCPDDYVIINGVRLCGERLNDAATDVDFTKDATIQDLTNGPWIIPFRTNQNTNGRGFRISFAQVSC